MINTAYGDVRDQPFDLRMRRTVPYRITEEGEKATERKRLSAILNEAIVATLQHTQNTDVLREQERARQHLHRALERIVPYTLFYQRAVHLIEELSQIPGHFAEKESPEHAEAVRRLRSAFAPEYHAFTTAMTNARATISALLPTLGEERESATAILAAIREVEETVQQLVDTSYRHFGLHHRNPVEHAQRAASALRVLITAQQVSA